MLKLKIYNHALEKTNDPRKISELYNEIHKLNEDKKITDQEMLESFDIAVSNSAVSGDSLSRICNDAGRCLEKNANLTEKVFKITKTALLSENSDSKNIWAFANLKTILSMKPDTDMIKDVLEVSRDAFSAGKLTSSEYSCLLSNAVNETADLDITKDVFDTTKSLIAKGCKDDHTLAYSCAILSKVVKNNPGTVRDVLDATESLIPNMIGYRLTVPNMNGYGFIQWHNLLGEVVESNPNTVKDVLKVTEKMLAGNGNGYLSLLSCYTSLLKMSDVRPDMVKDIFDVAEPALTNKHNTAFSLGAGYTLINRITDKLDKCIYVDPAFGKQLFETTKKMLSKQNNDEDGLKEGYKVLAKIVKYYKPDDFENSPEGEFLKELSKNDGRSADNPSKVKAGRSKVADYHPSKYAKRNNGASR